MLLRLPPPRGNPLHWTAGQILCHLHLNTHRDIPHIRMRARTQTNIHTNTNTYTQTRTHIHKHMHIRMHHRYTYTHTHKHGCTHLLRICFLPTCSIINTLVRPHTSETKRTLSVVGNIAFKNQLAWNYLTRSLPRAILTFHHPGGQHFWQCYFRF